MLSVELQQGKAAEHLVCADLILKGYSAFLSDAGLPYDVVAEVRGSLVRIQVKSTTRAKDHGKMRDMYRFGMRRSKGQKRAMDAADVDYCAFVALDIRAIAYLPVSQLMGKLGALKTCIEFRDPNREYPGRVYSNGTVRKLTWSKYITDYGDI